MPETQPQRPSAAACGMETNIESMMYARGYAAGQRDCWAAWEERDGGKQQGKGSGSELADSDATAAAARAYAR